MFTYLEILQYLAILVLLLKFLNKKGIFANERILAVLFILSMFSTDILRLIFDVGIGGSTGQFILRLSAFLSGGLLILFFSILLFGEMGNKKILLPRLYAYEKIILLLIPLTVLGFLIGVIQNNSIDYIVSDTYKWVIFPVAYFTTLKVIKRDNIFIWFKFFFSLMFILLFYSLLVQSIYLVQGRIVEFSAGGARYLIPFLLMGLIYRNKVVLFEWKSRTGYLILLLAISSVFLSFSRGEWIITLFGLFFIFLLMKKGVLLNVFSKAIPILLIIGLVVIPIGFVGAGKIGNLSHYTIVKIDKTFSDFYRLDDIIYKEERATGSLDVKIAEGVDAIGHINEKGTFLNVLVGMGNGAEYKTVTSKITSKVKSEKGDDYNHQIHNILFALFFRRGLIGTFLVIFLFSIMVITFFNAWKKSVGLQKILFGSFIIILLMILLRQMSTYYIFHSIPTAIFFGMCGVLLRAKIDHVSRVDNHEYRN